MQNLDVETIEELEKQEFYNYLQLGTPERFRSNFTELFGPFNTKDKPRAQPLRTSSVMQILTTASLVFQN